MSGPKLTTAEAARALGVTPARVRQLLQAQRLVYEPTPLGRLIDPASVARFKAEREAQRDREARHVG
jgi:hypothetical protein